MVKIKKVTAGVCAALMASAAMAPAAFAHEPSVEYTGGNGDPITHLYLIADDDNLATNEPEETVKSQAKVEVPVAINYVADANGTVRGPADGNAQIRNFSNYPVNVSNISVEDKGGATIEATDSALADDELYLTMTPSHTETGNAASSAGTTISLGNFKNHTYTSVTPANGTDLAAGDYFTDAAGTTHATGTADGSTSYYTTDTFGARPAQGAEWNIGASTMSGNEKVATILYLNDLGGKIGGFSTLDPAQKTEIGQITWTIMPGTFTVTPSPSQP